MNSPAGNVDHTSAGVVDKNVFLVGLMGAGKSTIGRSLASLLQRTFFDSDHEIEARTGAPVTLIFEIEGEVGFRQRESAVIEELTRCENIVLATGGGVVLAEENRRCLRSRGTVIYLHATLETLLERTRHDRTRPLLQTDDREGKLKNLLLQRDPLYRDVAHIVVETTHRPPATVAKEIVNRLGQYKHENAAARPG
ncbi:MAG TPA: shikimate kinase AroK [Burkholderiales bacterium]|nr:shikimate kinase AroK [Burkholderiales bacterium]